LRLRRIVQRLTQKGPAGPFFSMQNHFELLGLPVRYSVDSTSIERGYRDLQSRVHPDKFAAATEPERRVAMQWAARANEAYRTLRHPVERARYLLGLKGFDTEEESNTAMPPDFLMQQMEWREAVSEARAAGDARELRRLRGNLAESRKDMLRQLELAIDRESNFDAGCSLVRKLRFLDKLDEEIDAGLHGESAVGARSGQ
jgi:molecular chaperone HscB